MTEDPNLHFRVYCLRTGSAERELVGCFARYLEAEVFIYSELLHCADFGTDTGRFWGSVRDGGNVHYWVESPHFAASARQA